MSVKCFFIPQGLVIGEVSPDTWGDGLFTVKNPALVINRQNEIMLAPLLQLMEETEIRMLLDDVAFKTLFTPKIEISNHYNQIFGSGIIVSNAFQL